MTGLSWALVRLPVSLLLAGVQRTRALPAPAGGRPPGWPTPGMISLGLRALERSARAGTRRLDDPRGRWRELLNKVRAFGWFRAAGEPPEASATARDGATGLFADLWWREGRGYLHGREAAAGRAGGDPGLPRPDLIPHHTGMGLGLASHHFEGLGPRSSAAELGAAVDGFLADARRWSVPGYGGAVHEALGLTIELSHPRLLRTVDEELAARSASARSFYWHGVGRGFYFSPDEMAPRRGAGWLAVKRALETPPDEGTRRNAVAGVAWAATLVNFCDPRVIAARLREPRLDEAGDAAANGVASVTLLWLDAVGEGPLLDGFRAHGTGGDAGGLWRRRVADPVELAIEEVYPLLVEQERIDELFRYRPLAGWAGSLGESGRALQVPTHA